MCRFGTFWQINQVKYEDDWSPIKNGDFFYNFKIAFLKKTTLC